MSDSKAGWGGKREGAGRRPKAHDGTERKMRSTRASDEEWELIKEFAQLLKDSPEKAKKALQDLKKQQRKQFSRRRYVPTAFLCDQNVS